MKFYTESHPYYCGVDLHSTQMYICVLDSSGKKCLHRNIRNTASYFTRLMEDFPGVVIAAESTFNWYWLADLCARLKLPFILGHAFSMRAIHGAKVKNDRVDSEKIARLLSGGLLPKAYVYPSGMREARDLMRRRQSMVRKRGELHGHIKLVNMQYNLPSIGRAAHTKSNRDELPEHFGDKYVRKSIESNIEIIERYDTVIRDLEGYIQKNVTWDETSQLDILRSIRGIGPILSLTMLYEIHDINRFPRVQDFCSYSRVVTCEHSSAGKKCGVGNRKMGNATLKWAFSEAIICMMSHEPAVKDRVRKLERKYSSGKSKAIMRSKLCRSIYYMLKRKEKFDLKQFIS